MDVREEILTLRRQLEHANFLYYVKDAPEISDFEYDALMRRLEELEAAHPEYASPDSPTQHVGGYALNTFAQVRHQVPLESLQDVFSYDELRDFDAHVVRCSRPQPAQTTAQRSGCRLKLLRSGTPCRCISSTSARCRRGTGRCGRP